MSHTEEGAVRLDLKNRSRIHTGFMSNMIHSGSNSIVSKPQSQPQPKPQKTSQARPQFGSMFLRR